MAAGIATKSGADAGREALERQAAELEALLAQRDEEVGFLAGRLAGLEAVRAGAAAAAVTSSVTSNATEAPAPTFTGVEVGQPPPDPAAEAWARQDAELSGLALYAREPGGPEKGSRTFWRRQLDLLGAHLLPDAGPDDRLKAALRDRRGVAFLEALQACLR